MSNSRTLEPSKSWSWLCKTPLRIIEHNNELCSSQKVYLLWSAISEAHMKPFVVIEVDRASYCKPRLMKVTKLRIQEEFVLKHPVDTLSDGVLGAVIGISHARNHFKVLKCLFERMAAVLGSSVTVVNHADCLREVLASLLQCHKSTFVAQALAQVRSKNEPGT